MGRTSRLHPPAPLAPPALPPLHRNYGCSDSGVEARRLGPFCSSGGRYLGILISCCDAALLALHVLSLQSLPSPTTPLPPMTALAPHPSASWASRSHKV